MCGIATCATPFNLESGRAVCAELLECLSGSVTSFASRKGQEWEVEGARTGLPQHTAKNPPRAIILRIACHCFLALSANEFVSAQGSIQKARRVQTSELGN